MIYTVTFNPAIDYVVRLDTVKPGSTNRNKSEEIHFGGKGINVSMVLNELGVSSKALGFVAGFTGEAIEKEDKYIDDDRRGSHSGQCLFADIIPDNHDIHGIIEHLEDIPEHQRQ